MKRKYLLLIAIALISTNCNESYLEQSPQDKISANNFYDNAEDAELAINATYTPLRSIFDTDDDIIFEGTTDNGFANSQLSMWIIFSSNGATAKLWKNCYKGILNANIAIAKIPDIEMDENLKKRLLGEAHFLRGLYYYTLVTNFGGVPLALEPSTVENMDRPRSSKLEIVAQVKSDLDFAINNLPVVTAYRGTANLGRATKAAAQGFLARTHLWLGEWEQCVALCQNIMGGDYSLLPKYADNFTLEYENSVESIFEVQFHAGTTENVASAYSCNMSPRGNSQTDCGYGGLEARYDLVDSYEAGDERRVVNIYIKGDDFFGVPYDETLSGTLANPAKYIYPNTIVTQASGSAANQHVMRYAEIILMYAEANFMQSGASTEVLNAVNSVRTRAGLGEIDMADLNLDTILKERRNELAFEGLRLFDLRRTGLAESTLNALGIPYDADIHDLFPIPLGEIDTNPAISEEDQNPGYN